MDGLLNFQLNHQFLESCFCAQELNYIPQLLFYFVEKKIKFQPMF